MESLNLGKIMKFLMEIPSTITVLNFNMIELTESYKYSYLIEPMQNIEPQLVCFCTGNGMSDDWIVSSTILYKVPLAPVNDEVLRIEMIKMDRYNVPVSVFKEMLEHNEMEVCIDLGDEVYIYQDSEEDTLSIGTNTSLEEVVIPDLLVVKYNGVYVRDHVFKKRPHNLQYGRYKVQVGPDILLKIFYDDDIIMLRPDSEYSFYRPENEKVNNVPDQRDFYAKISIGDASA